MTVAQRPFQALLGLLEGNMKAHSLRHLVAAAVVASASALAPSVSAQTWKITDLGVLPGGDTSFAYKINNAGVIVGESNDAANVCCRRTVVWNGGVPTGLPLPPGTFGGSLGNAGINDAGQVVGLTSSATGYRGVRWDGMTPTSLNGVGGSQGIVFAINNSGVATGRSQGSSVVATVWSGNTPSALTNPPGAFSSEARDINSFGVVAGFAVIAGFGSRATAWSGAAPTLLGQLPGSVSSEARAINDSGVIVGYGVSGGQGRAIQWAAGVATALPLLPGVVDSEANGINAIGNVVGSASTNFGATRRPMLWKGGAPRDLFADSDATSKGWTSGVATGINDRGDIVGYGVKNGQTRGFVLNACTDEDGDGLCDIWEKPVSQGGGIRNEKGEVILDLNSMGADPRHKDIFVQVDYMHKNASDTHRVTPAAMQRIIAVFANAPVQNPDGLPGINLHVDCGSDCTMKIVAGVPVPWGKLSKARPIPHVDVLGSFDSDKNYDWTAFDAIKAKNFFAITGNGALAQERGNVFHYAISAHQYGSGLFQDGCSGGISRGIVASDFIIALGSPVCGGIGSPKAVGVTLMHELGHNLGLRHGGIDNFNFKPNHLSIMNYALSYSEVPVGTSQGISYRTPDYSRNTLLSLNKSALNELLGIGLPSVNGATSYWTQYVCNVSAPLSDTDLIANLKEVYAAGAIDWNCDQNISPAVSGNINGNFTVFTNGSFTPNFGTLIGYNEWSNLKFSGGLIGDAKQADQKLPDITPDTDPKWPKTSPPTAGVAYEVDVSSESQLIDVRRGQIKVLSFSVKNTGKAVDQYQVSVSASLPYIEDGAVPTLISLAPNESRSISIPIAIPVNAQISDPAIGFSLSVSLSAISKSISQVVGAHSVTVRVPQELAGDLNLDGSVDLTDLAIIQSALNTIANKDDPRDLNGDGRIDALDARRLTTLCTRPRCAIK